MSIIISKYYIKLTIHMVYHTQKEVKIYGGNIQILSLKLIYFYNLRY